MNSQEALLTTAIINNDTAREATLRSVINSTQSRLAQLSLAVQQYQPISNAVRSRNRGDTTTRVSAQVAAKALIATDSAPGTVTTKNVGRLSKLSDVIKFAAIAFALALLMMLGLILILELMRSGKRQDKPDGTPQGAFAWAPPTAQTRAAGPPATPAMAGSTTGGAVTRDPWRATATPSTVDGEGNGNGNGHDAAASHCRRARCRSRDAARRAVSPPIATR